MYICKEQGVSFIKICLWERHCSPQEDGAPGWLYLTRCHPGPQSVTRHSSCTPACLLLRWGRSQGDLSVDSFQNLKCWEQQRAFLQGKALLGKSQMHMRRAGTSMASPMEGIRGAASVWITSTKAASEASSRTSSGVPWKLASTGSNPKRDGQCCRQQASLWWPRDRDV